MNLTLDSDPKILPHCRLVLTAVGWSSGEAVSFAEPSLVASLFSLEALFRAVRTHGGHRAGAASRSPRGREPAGDVQKSKPGGRGPGRHGLPAERFRRAVAEPGPEEPCRRGGTQAPPASPLRSPS